MNLKTFVLGPLNTNCYVLWDGGEALVIDPGGDPSQVIEFLKRNNLSLKYIIATHGHFDHVLGVKSLKRVGGRFLMNLKDVDLMPLYYDWKELPPEPDDELSDGAELRIGSLTAMAISTPGHTMGSTSILVEQSLFTGDTLFKGTVGRYDLGGDRDSLRATLEKIKTMKVTDIFPGHGEKSTLRDEIVSNPFLNGVLGPDDW
ncbi:Hydroxyacylglutathione hydrolase [Metallosphaera sp. J1]|uniref:MBL fold metallo-hydrolase n=1 Tax=Metallosphaera TaxID=41980 RepID=UPI001EDE2A94|nr:MBL fold metallo-hydrolase [Metallosphaera javensis (ex Hofmann et al. 2022)]MCG3109635.1 Hydroxyacylglutathione hydrolase [Metallosphaera javensis (ex Hofmann et al. 2022)]BCS92433.1 MAG: MBL fold metallo-hydrolase [Metallosphaera javensis (ex Sakai et al. 2022)]